MRCLFEKRRLGRRVRRRGLGRRFLGWGGEVGEGLLIGRGGVWRASVVGNQAKVTCRTRCNAGRSFGSILCGCMD